MSGNNWLEHLERMTKEAKVAYKKDKSPHTCVVIGSNTELGKKFFDICPDCQHCPFNSPNTDKTLKEIELLKPQLQMIQMIKD